DGYCGDDDNGQTSAWYVCLALGFYPVCPGTDQYVLGTPLCNTVRAQLGNGRTLDIHGRRNGTDNRDINHLAASGEVSTKAFFTNDQHVNGATLLFTMGDQQDTHRVVQQTDFPYSLSMELP